MRGWPDKFSLFDMPGVEEEYLQNRRYPYKEVRLTPDISSNFLWFFRSAKFHTTNTNLVLAKPLRAVGGAKRHIVILVRDSPTSRPITLDTI